MLFRSLWQPAAGLGVPDPGAQLVGCRRRGLVVDEHAGCEVDALGQQVGDALNQAAARGNDNVRLLAESNTIVYATGRQESIRKLTLDWLRDYGFPKGELFMRADGRMLDAGGQVARFNKRFGGISLSKK